MIIRALLILMACTLTACSSNYDEIRKAARLRTLAQASPPPQTVVSRPVISRPVDSQPAPRAAVAPAIDAPAPFVPAPVVLAPEVVPEGTVTVRPGETLYALSRRLNIEVGDLVRANGLEPPYGLQAGRVLIVPAARYHRVRPGETAFAIARAYGVDLAVLARLNGLEAPMAARLGQRLKLPADISLETRAAQFTLAIPGEDTPRQVEPPPGASVPTGAAEPPAPPLPAAPAFAGRFSWPVDGRIVSRFGPKPGGLFNDGINIAAPMNTPIRAAAPGVVAYVGNRLSAFGNLLLIKHGDGWVTAYAHCADILVKRGDTIAAGEIVARVGRSGAIPSPQLHFEIRQGRKAVDPLGLLPRTAAMTSTLNPG